MRSTISWRNLYWRGVMTVMLVVAVMSAMSQADTVRSENKNLVSYIKWKHAYHQALTLKLFLSQAEFDGKYKTRDNGKSTVALTIEDAFNVIKKIDKLTLGIPKIVYLVGWQYNGHDSKYPAWFEGNERLKRAGDKNALESIKWLMTQAKQYHTTVSLHINMFDAYEDSPLFDEYVKQDIIAKNKDGSLRHGEWGYPISYAQEWKTRYAQKRIDSLCKLLPIQEAGTVHIDAFHTWPPMPVTDASGKSTLSFEKGVTSPYLSFTVADETAAQRNIFNYWASKGIDVTSEGVDFLRETDFAGYQPMAWWFSRSAQDYMNYPASYYTGGIDRNEWGKLFGSSMHGEQEIKEDTSELTTFLQSFCLNTVSWYYLNQLKRLYAVNGNDFKKVVFTGNVESGNNKGQYYLTANNDLLVKQDDVFLPALWTKEPVIIAFSKDGYEKKKWKLPASFRAFKNFNVYDMTVNGEKFLYKIKQQKNTIQLSIPPGKGYAIRPAK